MEEEYTKDTMTSIKTRLTIIGAFLGSLLLLGCSSSQETKDIEKLSLVYSQQPRSENLLMKKELDIYVDIQGDSILVKSNNPTGGNNTLRFGTLSDEDETRLHSIVQEINLERVADENIKGHCSYMLELSLNEARFNTCADSLPKALNALDIFLEEIISSSSQLEEINIDKKYLKQVRIGYLRNNKEEAKQVSIIDAYLLWKKMVFNSNKVTVDFEPEKLKYKIDVLYPPNYNGLQIKYLTSDDLETFYYSVEEDVYSVNATLQK